MNAHSWPNAPTAGSLGTPVPAFRSTGDTAQFSSGAGTTLVDILYDRSLNKPVNGFQGYTRISAGLRYHDYVESAVNRQYGFDIRSTVPKGLGSTERTAMLGAVRKLVMSDEFAAVIMSDLIPQ